MVYWYTGILIPCGVDLIKYYRLDFAVANEIELVLSKKGGGIDELLPSL